MMITNSSIKQEFPVLSGRIFVIFGLKKTMLMKSTKAKPYSHHWMMRVNICFMTKMIILPKQSGGQNCT